jgi:polar amino acid transport system ATP-binding protein
MGSSDNTSNVVQVPLGGVNGAAERAAGPQTAPRRPLIKLEEITKRYGDHTVVDCVSLEVFAGDVLAIIGPSGAGKSTLLRCINYLDPPSDGYLTIGDLRVKAGTPIARKDLSRLRRSTGMVFQSFNLFSHMTVLRNVSLAQERVLGRSRTEADERSMRLLTRVGVADKAVQYPDRCSGGQQQRIAIARALALEPQVMLFDEPTSSLDPELGLEVLAVMRELASEGMTMIVVTHEMHFAESVSDHVLIMADGRIIEHGSSSEVMRNPKVERSRRFLRAVRER